MLDEQRMDAAAQAKLLRDQLASVGQELEETRREGETDPLTRLGNRRGHRPRPRARGCDEAKLDRATTTETRTEPSPTESVIDLHAVLDAEAAEEADATEPG